MDAHEDYKMDGLADSVRLSRRGFAVTSLAAGFAAAVCPVSAATITTDAEGLMAGEIKIPVADGAIPGYRAMPASGNHHATILVVHEIFGVHEHIKDICRRLAKIGYYAIAPALFTRIGDVAALTDIQDIMKIVFAAPNDTVMTDLDSTVAFAESEKADTGRMGITGFCYGGVKVWLYTARNPKIKAGVAWYGQVVLRAGSPGYGTMPIEVADKIKGRVLGLYGALDLGISAEFRAQMLAALRASGDTESQMIVYPDAQHGFNADYRPSYNEAAAKAGWAEMLKWFKTHGVA